MLLTFWAASVTGGSHVEHTYQQNHGLEAACLEASILFKTTVLQNNQWFCPSRNHHCIPHRNAHWLHIHRKAHCSLFVTSFIMKKSCLPGKVLKFTQQQHRNIKNDLDLRFWLLAFLHTLGTESLQVHLKLPTSPCVSIVSSCMEDCCPLKERKHLESAKLQEIQDLAYTGYICRSKYCVLKTIVKDSASWHRIGHNPSFLFPVRRQPYANYSLLPGLPSFPTLPQNLE